MSGEKKIRVRGGRSALPRRTGDLENERGRREKLMKGYVLIGEKGRTRHQAPGKRKPIQEKMWLSTQEAKRFKSGRSGPAACGKSLSLHSAGGRRSRDALGGKKTTRKVRPLQLRVLYPHST